ncbi:MAG: hypothetical protein K2Q26_08715 [Bdellovibrionales bacterium]|nr:hypothetical protein [Bdellovibrionales bacterium]
MYKYWPYDETQFFLEDTATGAFRIETPWLITRIQVAAASPEYNALLQMVQNRENIEVQDMLLVSKILAELSKYPIAYQLPRRDENFGQDIHQAHSRTYHDNPSELGRSMGIVNPGDVPKDWLWDHEAALTFAACGRASEEKYDPLCLLSIARRFHYIDTVENKMDILYRKIENLEDPKDRKAALAIVVRQNHYVAEKCHQALETALMTAQSQAAKIQKFMAEGKSQDKILAAGLEALGLKSEQVPVTPSIKMLMHVFEQSARIHFLGFCLSLDFFEKPEFKETDSLAKALTRINADKASQILEAHKNINAHGEHEGLSSRLLEAMAPVSKEYALQALRMAELVSHYIAQTPTDLNQMIFND